MSKTQIIFEGVFHIGETFCEEIVFNTGYFSIGQQESDWEEDISWSISEYLGTIPKITRILKQYDSKWERDPQKPFVSIIGFFEENIEEEGDYENGYTKVMDLYPIVIALENFNEEQLQKMEGEDGY